MDSHSNCYTRSVSLNPQRSAIIDPQNNSQRLSARLATEDSSIRGLSSVSANGTEETMSSEPSNRVAKEYSFGVTSSTSKGVRLTGVDCRFIFCEMDDS